MSSPNLARSRTAQPSTPRPFRQPSTSARRTRRAEWSSSPPASFVSGAIFLKQGVNLLVEKDGVLKGTTNLDDYPQIQSRWEGTEEMYTASLVNAEGVTGLTISGEGTIDGSGDEWLKNNPFRRPAPRPAGAPGAGSAAAGLAPAAAAP
jgi:hypothetical protein